MRTLVSGRFSSGPVPPHRAPVFFREDDGEVSDFACLAGGLVTLHHLGGGIAPTCPMEKHDERIRPLVFGIPRREVQGVDDLIPRHGSLVTEVLLVLALVNARLRLSLHDPEPQSGQGEDKKKFHNKVRSER